MRPMTALSFTVARGFKSIARVWREYELDAKKPKEVGPQPAVGWPQPCIRFFAGTAVKPIGQSRLSPIADSRPADVAARRGSCSVREATA